MMEVLITKEIQRLANDADVTVFVRYADSSLKGGPLNFVLVDKEKRIRGYYDGTNIEDMDKLLDDIQILIKSYENS